MQQKVSSYADEMEVRESAMDRVLDDERFEAAGNEFIDGVVAAVRRVRPSTDDGAHDLIRDHLPSRWVRGMLANDPNFRLSEKVPEGDRDEEYPHVTKVVGKSFERLVTERADDEDVLFELYAPWCSHCQNFAPRLNDLAAYLNGSGVTVANMDMTANDAAGQAWSTQSFPKLLMVRADKREEPIEMTEFNLTAAGVLAFVKNHTTKNLDGLSLTVPPAPLKSEVDLGDDVVLASDVAQVVSANFERLVVNASRDVLIEFYAPWCGHCQSLEPTWNSIGARLRPHRDKLLVAKMDATANVMTDDQKMVFDVESFPTIYYYDHKKMGALAFDGGDRSEAKLLEFVAQHSGVDVRTEEEKKVDEIDAQHDEL